MVGAKLGDILVQKGIIQQQQLDAAVAVQGEEQLGQVLINWGWLTQDDICRLITCIYGYNVFYIYE